MKSKAKKLKKSSKFGEIMYRLKKNKLAMIGLFFIIFVIIIAIISPWIIPYPYSQVDATNRFATPSLQHLFGTDNLGRDIFSRVLYGARASMFLGLMATALSTAIGIVIGAIAGFFGGWVDNLVMRLLDILHAIPGILLCIAISAALGSGLINTVIAMSIGCIPMTVRLLRGQILQVREMEYLEAAQSINCSKLRMIMKYILPNSIAPLIVSITTGIGNTLLSAAMLSYIGLGVQPPTPEWGALLSSGRNYIMQYPHMTLYPGIVLALVVLAFNLLGDGLRDALDPRLKD